MSVSLYDTHIEFYNISKNKSLAYQAMARNEKKTRVIRNTFLNGISLYLKA